MGLILFTVLAFLELWTMYLAVMNLKRRRDEGTLPNAAKVLGYPILVVGLLLDFLFNAVIGTVLFLEFPQELLFTARVSRHKKSAGYKGRLAVWFCANLLDPFDPRGHHCSDVDCKID